MVQEAYLNSNFIGGKIHVMANLRSVPTEERPRW